MDKGNGGFLCRSNQCGSQRQRGFSVPQQPVRLTNTQAPRGTVPRHTLVMMCAARKCESAEATPANGKASKQRQLAFLSNVHSLQAVWMRGATGKRGSAALI